MTTASPTAARFLSRCLSVASYLLVGAWGFQYAYYRIFSQFWFSDDEGSMMLRVQAFLETPGRFDSIAGVYGPFYYLTKYTIYTLLGQEVSHDVNRLTTIVFWGLIAATCAVFVQRVTRSLVLAAIVQLQLILHLAPLVNEPGHPHEIALLLIAAALLLSSCVGGRYATMASMAGLGAAASALLLVKVNLGLFLCLPLSLVLLWSLPDSGAVRGLARLAAVAGFALPAAIMWRHLTQPWSDAYCATVTLVVAACMAATARPRHPGELAWGHVGVASGSAILVTGSVCLVIDAWGSSLQAVANAVILRAAEFSGFFLIRAPMTSGLVTAAALSLVLAVSFAIVARTAREPGTSTVVPALVKLAYGLFAFYSAVFHGHSLLLQAVPLPFVWLVMVPPGWVVKPAFSWWFPRAFLCLLAAFQMLQAYPVHGTQARWAGFLVIPLAAVCVGDAWRALVLDRKFHLPVLARLGTTPWAQPVAAALLVGAILTGYHAHATPAFWKAEYDKLQPLALHGADRVRLPPFKVDLIRWQVEQLRANCDGFVGMPGFPSLYFWTRIPPPGIVNTGWVLNLGDDRQRAIIDRMRSYERPCVIYNPTGVKSWDVIEPSHVRMPLAVYIRSEFEKVRALGPFELRLPRNRPDRTALPGATP